MKQKIILSIVILSLLSLVVFVMGGVFVVANEQEMYDLGYTRTVTCGNNVCEKMYFQIGQEETQVHNINNQQITFITENVADGKTIFHVNELIDRAGGAMQDLKSELKSKYGFVVSDASYIYEDPSVYYEDRVVKGHAVNIDESEYCPSDCMQGLGRIHIEQGWNILSEKVLTDLRLYRLNEGFDYESDITAVYQYIPILNKYILTKPRDNNNEEKIIQELVSKVGENRAEEILEQRNKAVWVYSTKTATLYYKQDSIKLYESLESIELFAGWNFVSITPNMINIDLGNLKGNCVITKTYFYNPYNNRWDLFSLGDDFEPEMEGMGAIIKVSESCVLGTSSDNVNDAIMPPQIPTN